MKKRARHRSHNGHPMPSSVSHLDSPLLVDRLWFPASQKQLAGAITVNLAKLTEKYGVCLGVPYFLKIDPVELRSVLIRFPNLPRGDKYAITELLVAIDKSASRFPGYIIPTSSIDEDWIYPDLPIRDASTLFTLAARVGLAIRHPREVGGLDVLPIELKHSDSARTALSYGIGQCFERASVLTAVLRKNGVHARIVGNPDFYSDCEFRGHWWVEACLDGKWISIDPQINNGAADIISSFIELGNPLGLADDPLLFFNLAEVVQHAMSVARSFNPINRPEYASKVANRCIAAEISLDECVLI